MRRLIVVVGVLTVLVAACGGDKEPATRASLAERKVVAGEVTVTIQPVRIAQDGAEFKIVLDTHSVELDLDVAGAARLVVDGTEWRGATWDGAGPGGHHREGTLRFSAGGPPAGDAVLTISGLDRPTAARWTLGPQ